MATQMLAERHRQLLEAYQIATVAADIVQRMRQRKLIGGDVFAKKNNAAPVVLSVGSI